jgi:TRAP-type C4-dicarboxylate transport system permease small subunit
MIMKHLLSKISAVFDRILETTTLVVGILLIFMLISVTTGVVMRYFIGRSLPWMIELTEYSMLYITFLAAAWLLREEKHIKIEFFFHRLMPKIQSLMNIITSIIGMIICLIVTWHGFLVTWEQFRMDRMEERVLDIPFAYIIVVVPVGFLFLSLQFLRRIYGYMVAWRTSTKRN